MIHNKFKVQSESGMEFSFKRIVLINCGDISEERGAGITGKRLMMTAGAPNMGKPKPNIALISGFIPNQIGRGGGQIVH